MKMRFSIIIPVYNRPQEVDELLESLCVQTLKDFEVVVVEDGSTEKCDTVCEKYKDRLALSYHFKPNSGPGPSRNTAPNAAKANTSSPWIPTSSCPRTTWRSSSKSWTASLATPSEVPTVPMPRSRPYRKPSTIR